MSSRISRSLATPSPFRDDESLPPIDYSNGRISSLALNRDSFPLQLGDGDPDSRAPSRTEGYRGMRTPSRNMDRPPSATSRSTPIPTHTLPSDAPPTGLDESEELQYQMKRRLENMQTTLVKNLTASYIRISKDKLTDCFWRSLPKFTRNRNGSSSVLALGGGKTRQSSGMEEDFELKISEDVLEALQKDITDELTRQTRGFLETVSRDLDAIKSTVDRTKQQAISAESEIKDKDRKIEVLTAEVKEAHKLLKEADLRAEEYKVTLRQKEAQMDFLREQVNRRKRMLEEQSTNLYKELIHMKMQLYEKDRLAGVSTSDPLSSSMPISSTGSETPKAGGTTPKGDSGSGAAYGGGIYGHYDDGGGHKEVEEKLKHQIRDLKNNFAKEKKMIVKDMKNIVDTQNFEIAHLKDKIKSLEEEIRHWKQRCRDTDS